jgi:hypothetical protein
MNTNSNNNPNANMNANVDNTQQIMKEIEKNTEEYVIKNRTSLTSAKLVNIMSKGADEFKEKTGRNMTYSEMREMFG